MSLLINPRVGDLDLLWLQGGILLLSQERRLSAVSWLSVGHDTMSLLP